MLRAAAPLVAARARALALLAIVVPSLLTSEVVTGTTSSVMLRKCGS